MEWSYQGKKIEDLPQDCEGFVYLITNTTNNRKYVGKKLAKFKKTRPPLKGKKNKRRSKVESDWRDYWGSSDHLNADVKGLGEDKFTREMAKFVKRAHVLRVFMVAVSGITSIVAAVESLSLNVESNAFVAFQWAAAIVPVLLAPAFGAGVDFRGRHCLALCR